MSTTGSKPAFDYHKSFLRRWYNSIKPVNFQAILFTIGLLAGTSGIIKRAIQNGMIWEQKKAFIKDIVLDPKRREFDYLDEEEPPIPLEQLSAVDQFKQRYRSSIGA